MTSTPADPTSVPHAISAYQAAHDRSDGATALAQFADDATVVDDGRTYVGIAGVESFLSTAASEYTYTRTLVSAVGTAPSVGASPITSKETSQADRSTCRTSSSSLTG